MTGAPQPELPWYHDGEEVVADYSKELAGHGEGTILCQQTGTAIPVAMFGSHVERNHAGQNQAFKDEYQVHHQIFIMSLLPMSVDSCRICTMVTTSRQP